ncbi:DUF6286 domain-containing protein [Cellulomonas fimi]|uniref:DUF6286 domain-containing protein n=1 Tax=Cellulomonas fimi TaxID=1708 RepID=A0A7Y0LXN4_CELFI|nr:DUF6286 domain-containing protein [Cellulomonas fimi]NMR20078.1 hypothetical protein [Cellulomonas fimi]
MVLTHRILAALFALALLLGGFLGAVEILLARLGQPPWLVPHPQWSAWLGGQTWDAGAVRTALAVLALLGLLLVILALRRGKPRALALPPRPGHTPAGVTVTANRRGVEASLSAAARRTSAVSSAATTLGGRSATTTVVTSTRSAGNLQRDVTTAISRRLAELGLADTVRPRVTIKHKGH